MKSEKQKLVLEILGNGKYRVDRERGVLQSFRKNVNDWVDCVHTLLPSKYKQNVIHLGRGQNTKVTVYLHVLVWIACNGEYDEGMVIDHEDSDPSNCALSNLRLVTQSSNIEFSIKNRPKTQKDWRVIRSDEIAKIRELVAAGKNQSAIARTMDLNRLSVRRIVNKIKNGEELKFENEKPKINILSVSTETITGIPKGEYKLIGAPGKSFHYEPTINLETPTNENKEFFDWAKKNAELKWKDMPADEVAKEAIPHYKEKFKL